jgi:hypothetical protein
MTLADQQLPTVSWNEPDGLMPHRTVAAAVVLFLERIRQEAGPRPIAVWEQLRQ